MRTLQMQWTIDHQKALIAELAAACRKGMSAIMPEADDEAAEGREGMATKAFNAMYAAVAKAEAK
jgi:hypothetical protein